MRRFLRNSAILMMAAVAVIAAAVYTQSPSGGKAPAADPHGHGAHGHGAHGHNEGSVELSDAKVAAAGIELEKAGPGVLRDSLLVNGILQPNQEAMVQCR